MKSRRILGLIVPLLMFVQACSTTVHPFPVTAENNVDRLLAHPQFEAAARVAPEFTTDALKTIARLEKEKANAGAR